MSRAVWTLVAQADLADLDDYYRPIDAALADRIGRDAVAAGRFLAAHPGAGAGIAGRWRRWRVARTPYLLFYRIVPEGVAILRVHHDRQAWPDLA